MSTPISVPNHDVSFRLLDFNIFDEKRDDNADADGEGADGGDSDEGRGGAKKYKKDEKFTTIQMFGLNEKGETCAIFVRD